MFTIASDKSFERIPRVGDDCTAIAVSIENAFWEVGELKGGKMLIFIGEVGRVCGTVHFVAGVRRMEKLGK